MSVTYGHSVTWHSRDTTMTVTVSKCNSPAEALREVWESAKAFGYEPPRWWQWWRWGEAKP